MKTPKVETVLVSVVFGLFVGTGAFTFIYARGYSYLTDDPAACANCHIMDGHFDAWLKSSHRAVAVCNDCHTPSSLVPKYANKASNGFWHSFAFTIGRFPDPLRIKAQNLEVTEQACLKCHREVAAAMLPGAHQAGLVSAAVAPEDVITCTRCHGNVGHWVR